MTRHERNFELDGDDVERTPFLPDGWEDTREEPDLIEEYKKKLDPTIGYGWKWRRETKEKLEPPPSRQDKNHPHQAAIVEAKLWFAKFQTNGGKAQSFPKYKHAKPTRNGKEVSWNRYTGEKNSIAHPLTRPVYNHVNNAWRWQSYFGSVEYNVLTFNDGKYVDSLRNRRDAKEEYDWFRYRGLRKPYVPEKELACDPHSIKSNVPFGFEKRFIAHAVSGKELRGDTYLFLSKDNSGRKTWVQADSNNDEYHDGLEDFTPSTTVNDLVKPDFTNSLDRLFGCEVDEAALTKEGLRNAPRRVREAWDAFSKSDAWKESCKKQRNKAAEDRAKEPDRWGVNEWQARQKVSYPV